jgi:hypothetical protein
LRTGCLGEYLDLRRGGGVIGGWREIHNEELHNLYSSPDIIRMIKAMRVKWLNMKYVWGRKEMHTKAYHYT